MVTLVGAGMRSITADQAGSATYAPATQAVQSFSVGKASATLALSSSVNPSTPGQSVTFTLAVSGTVGTPTGTVTFSDGGAPLCSNVALDVGGSAYCTTSVLVAERTRSRPTTAATRRSTCRAPRRSARA